MAYVLKNNIRPRGSELSNINVRNEEIKYVKNGEGNLFYDIQKEIIYDIPRVALIYPSIITPPEGGTNSPSYIDYRQTWRREGYSGDQYEQDEIINTGATITYSIIDGEGATVDNNGTVTWESRGVEYGASIRAATVEIQVELNGKIGKATAVVRQDKNIITNMELVNIDPGTLKPLPEFEAWEEILFIESETPAKADCQLTYSSGDISLEYEKYVDFKIEYSWESDQEYVVIDPEQIEESCTGKVLSRGIEFGKDPRTAIVTRKAKIKASLKPRYKEAEPVEEEKECTIEVIQKPNLLFIIEEEFIVTPGAIQGPDMYLAKEETKTINNIEDSKVTGVLEFSSKERVTDLDTYGTLEGPIYSWESNQEYAKVDNQNVASTTVTMDSRGIIVGPEREAIITRHVKWVYTLDSVYGGASISDDTKFCTTTITQQENTVSIKDFIVDPGSIKAPDTYSAGEETKTIESEKDSTVIGTLVFTSEESVTDLSTYGELILTYSWSSNQSYAIVNNQNSASTTVTMSSRTTSLGAERSATITRCANWKLTISEIYGEGSIEDTKCCTTTVKQQGNYVSKVEALVANSSLGSHFYYPSINEYGGPVSPIGNGNYQFWLSSGAGPYTSLSGVSVNTSRIYTTVTPNSYASLNTTNGVITWSPNKVNIKQYVTIGSTYSVSCTGGGVTVSDSLYGTATAMMEEVKIVYSIPTLYLINSTIISAGGGSIKKSELDIRYSQIKTTYLPSGRKDEELTSGGDLTYELYDADGNIVSEVSGEDLLKNIQARTYKGYIVAQVTMNGKTRTETWNIYQEANVVTLDTSTSLSHSQVSYYGGYSYSSLSHSCRVRYTSGSSESRIYSGSANYSSGKLTISKSSYSSTSNSGATLYSDGDVYWERYNNTSRNRSITVYLTVYYTFEYNISGFTDPSKTIDLSSVSTQLKMPEEEIDEEYIYFTFSEDSEYDGNSEYMEFNKDGETKRIIFQAMLYQRWKNNITGNTRSSHTDITSSGFYDFNYDNTTYFRVSKYINGMYDITARKKNESGENQISTIEIDYIYYSESGNTIQNTLKIITKQESYQYYLYIDNYTDFDLLFSTNRFMDGQDVRDLDVTTVNSDTEKVNITNGIETNTGLVSYSTTIYVYKVVNHILERGGSFGYEKGKDHSIIIN